MCACIRSYLSLCGGVVCFCIFRPPRRSKTHFIQPFLVLAVFLCCEISRQRRRQKARTPQYCYFCGGRCGSRHSQIWTMTGRGSSTWKNQNLTTKRSSHQTRSSNMKTRGCEANVPWFPRRRSRPRGIRLLLHRQSPLALRLSQHAFSAKDKNESRRRERGEEQRRQEGRGAVDGSVWAAKSPTLRASLGVGPGRGEEAEAVSRQGSAAAAAPSAKGNNLVSEVSRTMKTAKFQLGDLIRGAELVGDGQYTSRDGCVSCRAMYLKVNHRKGIHPFAFLRHRLGMSRSRRFVFLCCGAPWNDPISELRMATLNRWPCSLISSSYMKDAITLPSGRRSIPANPSRGPSRRQTLLPPSSTYFLASQPKHKKNKPPPLFANPPPTSPYMHALFSPPIRFPCFFA